MRLVFMGTPEFALPSLEALLAAGHRVVGVYSQPPRPAGRGRAVRPSPVQRFAAALGLPIRLPARLNEPAEADAFAALAPEAAVVAAYGLILPKPMLETPRLGCLNVHASLLPRWRGAAPIQRAILAGDPETGVTIMRMDEGLDTGPIVAAERLPIGPRTTAGELHDALAQLGAHLIVRALADLDAGRIAPLPQPTAGASHAGKIRPGEERIDWSRPAAAIERAVRAFDPWPGAFFEHAGLRIKVWAAEPVATAATAAPGTVLDACLAVACGEGALRLTHVQRPGRQPLAAAAFLRGYPIAAGTRLA